jgi:hypothetical protein
VPPRLDDAEGPGRSLGVGPSRERLDRQRSGSALGRRHHLYSDLGSIYVPVGALCDFPDLPLLRSEVVVAIDSGSLQEAHQALEESLARSEAVQQAVSLVSGRPVVFYLDAPGFPECSPLVRHNNTNCRDVPRGVGAAL